MRLNIENRDVRWKEVDAICTYKPAGDLHRAADTSLAVQSLTL